MRGALFLLVFLGGLASSVWEDEDDSFLLGFKRVEKILGPVPRLHLRIEDKASWWIEELQMAEKLVRDLRLYSAIEKYQIIFAACCGTLGEIKVCA